LFPHLNILLGRCGNNLWGFFFDLLYFLLLQPLFFILVDEVIHQLRLNLNLLDALWVRPVLDSNHGALLLPGPEFELFLVAIDVEADFSGSNIDLCSHSAEERSPKDEGRFFCCFYVEHHEVDRDEVTPDFYQDVFSNPRWVADR